MDQRLAPLWRAYQALPYGPVDSPLTVLITRFVAQDAKPPGAVAMETGPSIGSDNRWSYQNQKGYLWCGPDEDAPPIVLGFDVPNGEYDVHIWLLGAMGQADAGTAILVKGENDKEFRELSAHVPPGKKARVPLGTYIVQDGTFDLILDDSPHRQWSTISNVTFVPSSRPDISSLDELNEREEELRALGYME